VPPLGILVSPIMMIDSIPSKGEIRMGNSRALRRGLRIFRCYYCHRSLRVHHPQDPEWEKVGSAFVCDVCWSLLVVGDLRFE